MFLLTTKTQESFSCRCKKKKMMLCMAWGCALFPAPPPHTTDPWMVEMVGPSVPLSGASNLGGHCPRISTAHTHYLPAGTLHATNQECRAVCEMRRGTYRLGPVCRVSPWWEVSITTSASGGPCSHGFFCQLERPYICPRSNQVAHPPILLMLLHLFYKKT